MSKQLKPGRTTIELRPSRIRRDPPAPGSRIRRDPPARPEDRALKFDLFDLEEREAWVVAVGVLMFALAIAIIIIGFSDYTSG